MKRNVDEIKRLTGEVKRLNYEIGRRDKKIADQQVELTKAKKDVDVGLQQVRDIFHSVLVSMALTYGKEAPEGTYTIEMPVGHTTGNKLNFDVDIKRTDYDTSVVTVTEKTKDKEAGGNV